MKEFSSVYVPSVHASVIAREPWGETVLVKDPQKNDPLWKYSGGGCEFLELLGRRETPEETARRELLEETGLLAKKLRFLIVIDRGTHVWYLFEARFENFDGLLRRGNDGEIVSTFRESQIMRMPDFLPLHREVTKDLIDGKILNFAMR